MRQRNWLVVSYAITLLFIWVSIARLENSSTQGREHGAISIAVTLENCILGPFTVLFFLPFTVLNPSFPIANQIVCKSLFYRPKAPKVGTTWLFPPGR